MKNFLLMLLDNVLQLVLWGLGLLAFFMMILLVLQHQLGSAVLALVVFGIFAGTASYRKGWGGRIPWDFRMMRRSDELPGMSNLPGSSSYVSDVLDETQYKND